MLSLNSGWEFVREWSADFFSGLVRGETVRLPHIISDVPLHYSDESVFNTVCGYKKEFYLPEADKGKRLFLRFDGAAHRAGVYINGKLAAENDDGYSVFRVEATDFVRFDSTNTIAVRLDCTPFEPEPGKDLSFGGLYGGVWLDTRPMSCIRGLKLSTPGLKQLRAEIDAQCEESLMRCRVSVLDGEKKIASAEGGMSINLPVFSAVPWTPENPRLYTCRAELIDAFGTVMDSESVTFCFRTVKYEDGILYLNGKPTMIKPLVRQQYWPYAGPAVPELMQREDARVLKEELYCSAVIMRRAFSGSAFADECLKRGIVIIEGPDRLCEGEAFDRPVRTGFGSEDRMLHTGSADAFRNRKTATAPYRVSQDAVSAVRFASAQVSEGGSKTVIGSSGELRLELNTSRTKLTEGDSYDMVGVRIRICTASRELAPLAQLPVTLKVTGPAELVGPSVVVLEGGMAGTYIKTTGNRGIIILTVSAPQVEDVSLEFTVV